MSCSGHKYCLLANFKPYSKLQDVRSDLKKKLMEFFLTYRNIFSFCLIHRNRWNFKEKADGEGKGKIRCESGTHQESEVWENYVEVWILTSELQYSWTHWHSYLPCLIQHILLSVQIIVFLNDDLFQEMPLNKTKSHIIVFFSFSHVISLPQCCSNMWYEMDKTWAKLRSKLSNFTPF